MNTSETFIRYSLRNRLFVLAGATFFLCAVVILLFFPLLNLTLEGLQNRTVNAMQTAAEVEAACMELMVRFWSPSRVRLSRGKNSRMTTAHKKKVAPARTNSRFRKE